MENEYYVYVYRRLDNGTIFYVGKGKNNRCFRLDSRNQHFLNIINLVDYKVEKIYENLSEDDAFRLEIDTIHKLVFCEGYSIDISGYNDKNNKKHLVNCTWGGEGTSGLSIKQSKETIEKRRLKNIGQKRTPEQRKRMSEAQKTRKPSIKSKETIENQYNKSSYTQGTHIHCVELNMDFSSKRKVIEYMKETYNIPFNKKSFKKHLEGGLVQGKSWYGEIIIGDEIVQLHWEII